MKKCLIIISALIIMAVSVIMILNIPNFNNLSKVTDWSFETNTNDIELNPWDLFAQDDADENQFDPNEYDEMYDILWISQEGTLEFINDNKIGFDGDGCYEGVLSYNGKEQDIEVLQSPSGYYSDTSDGYIEIYSKVRVNADNCYSPDSLILDGDFIFDKDMQRLELKVGQTNIVELNKGEKDTPDLIKSPYAVGDVIIFSKA